MGQTLILGDDSPKYYILESVTVSEEEILTREEF